MRADGCWSSFSRVSIAATPGEWEHWDFSSLGWPWGLGSWGVLNANRLNFTPWTKADAALIVALRNHAPALIAEIRAAREAIRDHETRCVVAGGT